VEKTRDSRRGAFTRNNNERRNRTDVTVIDGVSPLVKAAETAFKQWRYKPTTVDGVPVDVQTTVAFTFALNPVKK
jgi:hypothetical protein